MSEMASIIDRRASQLESLSTALFEIGRAQKKKKENASETAGKKSFSPATLWMKPMVTGLHRFRRGSRNHELVRGVTRFSRSRMYHKRGVWAVKAKNGGQLPVHPKHPAKSPAVARREPKFYPAEEVPKPLHKNVIANAPKLRANITPGTVLILLAGRFKGKRVVFLKQLDSGLLLVTGPFNLNGVPLRRVNQSYVISTSTKLDVRKMDLKEFGDSYFKREAVPKKRKTESAFFQAEEGSESEGLSEERKKDQILVDAQLMPRIERVPDMKGYLNSRFSLKAGMKPHLLVF